MGCLLSLFQVVAFSQGPTVFFCPSLPLFNPFLFCFFVLFCPLGIMDDNCCHGPPVCPGAETQLSDAYTRKNKFYLSSYQTP